MKNFSLYLAVAIVCYFLAWTAAFVAVNGPSFGTYFEYLRYFWSNSGGERPAITGMLSIALGIFLSSISIWLLRSAVRKKTGEGQLRSP